MSYIIFEIEDLIQVVSDKESRERLHTFMSKCASYGIYFIFASQDCTKEVIVENITKYEYYPVGISEMDLKDKNIIKYKYIEGEKDGIKAFIGKDLEDNLKIFDI